ADVVRAAHGGVHRAHIVALGLCARDATHGGARRLAFWASGAATYAVRAADHAIKAGGSDFWGTWFDSPPEPIDWPEGTHAEDAWPTWHAWASAAVWIIPANAQAAAVAARLDLDRLRGLGLGRFAELGEPLDPSADGPLGPLWPEAPRCADAS